MERFQPLFDWIAANPGWAIAFVAITSLIDALLIVGYIVPSYILLLGVGALIALELLPLGPLLLAAVAGALTGDLLNYWLGRRYLDSWSRHHRLLRYRDTMESTREIFRRRGGIALVVSRLLGPARPVGPMIAGAIRMSLPKFVLWAVPSCTLWALLYIVPGVALGASLQMAAEVATRLALLLLGAIALVLLIAWIASLLVRGSAYYAERNLHRLLAWSARHRRLGLLPRQLTDPRYPETPALLIIALLLLATGWLALTATWGLGRDTPMAVDALVFRAMSDLHTPWGLAIARWIAHLGDLPVLLVVSTAGVITLFALRRGRAAAHAIAALAFGGAIALVLSLGLRAPSPQDFYDAGTDHGHSQAALIFATMVYLLVPLLLARPGGDIRNIAYYRLPAIIIALVAAAHIYLGSQWFSIAIGSILLGVMWMLVLGIGYRRHRIQPIPARRFLPTVVLSFLAASIALAPEAPQRRPDMAVEALALERWWDTEWQRIPLVRGDSTGRVRQPLALQWLATESQRNATLADAGWQPAERLQWDTALRYLAPSAELESIPIPPQYLRLNRTQAVFQRPLEAHQALEVLRLWHSGFTVDGVPIWVGSLNHMHARQLIGIMQLPYTLPVAFPPADLIAPRDGLQLRLHRHPFSEGPMVLLRSTTDPNDNDD